MAVAEAWLAVELLKSGFPKILAGFAYIDPTLNNGPPCEESLA